MNCPQCEKPIEPDQYFCRGCGMKLMTDVPNRARTRGIAVLGLIFIGLMVAIFGKMFEVRWLAYSGLVVMMTGAFIIAAYGLIRETRPRKTRSIVNDSERPSPLPIEKADTTNKLLPVGVEDYVPSVVENTTELLEIPVKR